MYITQNSKCRQAPTVKLFWGLDAPERVIRFQDDVSCPGGARVFDGEETHPDTFPLQVKLIQVNEASINGQKRGRATHLMRAVRAAR